MALHWVQKTYIWNFFVEGLIMRKHFNTFRKEIPDVWFLYSMERHKNITMLFSYESSIVQETGRCLIPALQDCDSTISDWFLHQNISQFSKFNSRTLTSIAYRKLNQFIPSNGILDIAVLGRWVSYNNIKNIDP